MFYSAQPARRIHFGHHPAAWMQQGCSTVPTKRTQQAHRTVVLAFSPPRAVLLTMVFAVLCSFTVASLSSIFLRNLLIKSGMNGTLAFILTLWSFAHIHSFIFKTLFIANRHRVAVVKKCRAEQNNHDSVKTKNVHCKYQNNTNVNATATQKNGKSSTNTFCERTAFKNGQQHDGNKNNIVQLSIDVPGVKASDLHVTVDANRVLAISGSRTTIVAGDMRSLKFARKFSLKTTVDTGNLSANLIDGVLTIKAPKIEKPLPMQVTVTQEPRTIVVAKTVTTEKPKVVVEDVVGRKNDVENEDYDNDEVIMVETPTADEEDDES